MKAYGQLAQMWPQRALDAPYVVTDTSSSAAAFVDIVETRRAGRHAGLIPLFEHPRRRLLRAICSELISPPQYDVFLERMNAFLAGNVSVNGRTQAENEAAFYPPASSGTFQHAALASDGTVFRSRYEAELVARFLQHRPAEYTVAIAPDPSVPEPQASSGSDHIALWIGEADEPFAELARRLISDIPRTAVVVRPGPQAGALLARARLIVSISDDPGTAIALAEFQKPLACATPGALEYLDNVACFELWNASAAIDAVQRALGSPPPARKPVTSGLPQDVRRTTRIPTPVPLVSIIITVYDRLRHLDENLARLQRQTYPNIEIIVVSNNGPRADDICSKYKNVRYIHRVENSGAAGETRNDGIAAARGTYIVALDDDDIFFDDHIAAMVEICESGADVVYSDFFIQIIEPRDDGDYLVGYDIEIGTAITAHELLVMNRLGYMTIFARRSVYESFPVAYDQINVRGASEVELWLRMAQRFAIAKSPRPTTLYTIRKNWKGSVTAVHHFMFADGYAQMYDLYPAHNTAYIDARRQAHLASLRAAGSSPAREARYPVSERKV